MNAKVSWWFEEAEQFDALMDAANNQEELNQWAASFISGVTDRWQRFGMDMFLSPKQLAIVIDIGNYGNKNREQADADVQQLQQAARKRTATPADSGWTPPADPDGADRWEPSYDHDNGGYRGF